MLSQNFVYHRETANEWATLEILNGIATVLKVPAFFPDLYAVPLPSFVSSGSNNYCPCGFVYTNWIPKKLGH